MSIDDYYCDERKYYYRAVTITGPVLMQKAQENKTEN